MTAGTGPGDGAAALRAVLRPGLTRAMKARETDTVTARRLRAQSRALAACLEG